MLKYVEYKDFTREFARLRKKGGSASAASNKVTEAVTCWKNGLPTDLHPTKHGESRLAHVVKYDLPAFHRLVVREHAGLRVALFVGSHDDVDKWLNSHHGYDFAIDSDTKCISLAPALSTKKQLDETELDVYGDG